jgi:hypothetical protein
MCVQDRDRSRRHRASIRRMTKSAVRPWRERERAVVLANQEGRALAIQTSVAAFGEELFVPEPRLRRFEIEQDCEQQREHAAGSQARPLRDLRDSFGIPIL